MRISRILSLSGPNVWSRKSVIEVRLSDGPAEPASGEWFQTEGERIADWWSAACAAAGTTADKWLAIGEQLRRADDKLEAFQVLVQGLQTLAGTPVDEAWIESECGSRAVCIAVEFVEEPVARLAVDVAHRLVWGSRPEDPRLAELHARAGECCFGTTTRAIVAAARSRRIPVSRVDDDCLLQLGHGARQRRIQGAITGRAGFLAELVSRDKLLTKRLLRQLHVPTAEGRLVASAEDAWAAACEIGLPVVVKPRDADYGNGVSLGLMSEADVAAAWERARQRRPEVLVERQLAGVPHRLFVVNNRVVASARREPAHVVGDGRLTVGALIDCANRDPRRGENPDCPMYPIRIDAPLVTALARQSLGLDGVPAAGRIVNLQLDPSECRAETVVDVTDDVHPDVSAAAIDAVGAVGLDVAGVDVVAVNIGRPLEEQGGGILEVNAGPAIFLHRSPQCQPERPVAEAIVESLFAAGDTGCIPLIAVVGEKRAAAVALAIAELVDDGAHVVGAAGTTGIVIGGRHVSAAAAADAAGCRTLLAHPRIELAVCELSPESIRNEGLPFEECTVAVLAGFDGAASEPALAREREQVLRLMIETAAGSVLANAEDAEVAAACRPGQPRLIAVALAAEHPFLVAHRLQGGMTAFSDGDGTVFADPEGKAGPANAIGQVAAAPVSFPAVTMEALLASAATLALYQTNHATRPDVRVTSNGQGASTGNELL
jgi:cyanophycin synthetase